MGDKVSTSEIDSPSSELTGSVSDFEYHADDDDSGTTEKDPFLDDSKSLNTSMHKHGVLSHPVSSLDSARKLILGIVIVCVIAVSWVGSTQTAKSTYTTTFRAPFFLVWFGTCWMSGVFFFTIPLYFIEKRCVPNIPGFMALMRHSLEIIFPTGWSHACGTFLSSTVLFTLIWVPTNYMYARALISIAATDVTALFSSAPAFVFLLSIVILREPPLMLRFVAVAMAIAGVVLFAYEDGFDAVSNVVGVLLSVGSAIGAAFYKTLLKWRIKNASLYQMGLLLSSIGILNMVVLWPLVLILHYTGAEKVADVPWEYMCGSAALGVVFNFSINFGIAYTFPLFISLGTILGIPLNATVDAVFRYVDLANWKLTAMDLIIGGFLLMLLPPRDSQWIQRFFPSRSCCK